MPGPKISAVRARGLLLQQRLSHRRCYKRQGQGQVAGAYPGLGWSQASVDDTVAGGMVWKK